MVHQEADCVAVLAATEAVIKLFGRADREGWRLFAMEGAQATKVGAALFQLYIAPDDLHDVGARYQFLNECLRNGHSSHCGAVTPADAIYIMG